MLPVHAHTLPVSPEVASRLAEFAALPAPGTASSTLPRRAARMLVSTSMWSLALLRHPVAATRCHMLSHAAVPGA